jgi:tetratricopeptide (TPR) repeat protein
MTDSTRQDLEDRYVRDELTAAESRELAQESLEDPELFENLTFSAVAKGALSERSVRERLEQPDSRVVRFPWKTQVFVWGAAAAAVVLLVSLYSLRSSFRAQNQTAAIPSLKPTLGLIANAGQPILLASGLQPEGVGREGAQVFRSPEPPSRSPKAVGSIVSIEDGLAAVDLGSLDGLAKGSELGIFRDERSTQLIGRLIVTTVFRERARGRMPDGQELQVNYQVRVAGAVHLDALLEQADALAARGEADAARTAATKAAEWAEAANVPTGERRKAWQRLGALEYQADSFEAAEKHYQAAVDSLNAAPPASLREQSEAFNTLAVLHLLRGDYGGAEAPLNQAVSKSPKTDIAYGRGVNNLGVMAEMGGDRKKAEAFYTDALRAFEGLPDLSGQERRAVESNLARLRSLR